MTWEVCIHGIQRSTVDTGCRHVTSQYMVSFPGSLEVMASKCYCSGDHDKQIYYSFYTFASQSLPPTVDVQLQTVLYERGNMGNITEVKRIHHGARHALLHLPHAVGTDGELLLGQLDPNDPSGDFTKPGFAVLGDPGQITSGQNFNTWKVVPSRTWTPRPWEK